MDINQIFDILRIVLLIIQLLSAGITILLVVKKGKISIFELLNKLSAWYKKAYEDGKITPEELTEVIVILKDLSNMSDKDKKQ